MQTQSKFTPGPWKVLKKENGPEYLYDDGRAYKVCCDNGNESMYVMIYGDGFDRSKRLANAALISAAPELLEALELILPLAKGYAALNPLRINSEVLLQAEKALAKAQGG